MGEITLAPTYAGRRLEDVSADLPDGVQVTISLMDMRSEEFVWSDSFTANLAATEFYLLRDDIADQVARALHRNILLAVRYGRPAAVDDDVCAARAARG